MVKPEKKDKPDIAGLYEYKVSLCNSMPDTTELCGLIRSHGKGWELISILPFHKDDPYAAEHKELKEYNYAMYFKRIREDG